MPRRRSTLAGVAAVGALAAILQGCGGDPVRASDGVIDVVLAEYRIEPQRIEIAAGRVVLKARNDGVLAHNVAIVDEQRPGIGIRENVHLRVSTLRPGQEQSAEGTLRPGRYRLVCMLGNHDNLGQHGELVVVDGD